MSVTVCRVTIVKSFTYRDLPEEFSNSYAFKGAPPSEGDDASWLVLFNDVLNREKGVFTSGVTFHRAYGYNSSDPKAHHVAAHDWTLSPPAPTGIRVGAGIAGAGDQAACVAFLMNRKSKKGKPVYLRKYLHDCAVVAGDPNRLDPTYLGHCATYFGSGVDGIQSVHGGLRTGLDYKGAEPPNDSVIGGGTIGWVTTRTLKRRGKRPKAAS